MSALGSKQSNTPIVVNNYNSRGLITHNRPSGNLVRQADGTLWALIAESSFTLTLFESTDNGFSWLRIREDFDGCLTSETLNANSGFTSSNGPSPWLIINEKWNRIQSVYPNNVTGSTVDIQGSGIAFDDIADTTASLNSGDIVTAANSEGAMGVTYNLQDAYVTNLDASSNLRVRKFSPRTDAVSAPTTLTLNPIFKYWSSVVTEDSICYFLVCHNTGGNNIMKSYRWEKDAAGFTVTTILDLGADTAFEPRDMQIAYDGLGNLVAVFSVVPIGSSGVTNYWAYSNNEGNSWTVAALTRTSGHTFFTDDIMNEETGRIRVMGGSSGFIMGYVEVSANGLPRAYVRLITTANNGTTYTLGDEKEIGTTTSPGRAITGFDFFRPTDTKLLDLSDPGLIRVGYQVGEGDSAVQVDHKAVDFYQELLYLSAYPTTLDSLTGSWNFDTRDGDSIAVLFDILGAPSNNRDWYALGATGPYTDRYIAAFDKIGTAIRLLKYEPDQSNFLSDQSAYGEPTEYASRCIFQPISYKFPAPDLTIEGTTDYIEQDVRLIHLPPNFFLSRQFVVNTGGYLKRTVWLCEYHGNQYEISQVVPRFFNNQIVYYVANAYVVGPSRDPFSRDILPSET